MSVNGVSFGSVVAVSGKKGKINKVNNKLQYHAKSGQVIMKDVTEHYRHAPSSGLLAQSVQRGDKLEIYITGKDVDKVKSKQSGWDTLDGILSNLSSYIQIDRMSTGDVVDKIFRS